MLDRAESSLLQSDCLPLATQYIHAAMSEAVNPLESLNNLLYLVANASDDAVAVRRYAEMAEAEIARLNRLVQRMISFCRS